MVVGFFDGLFGKGRALERARKAELRGDLAGAVEAYVAAGAPEEASRVLVLRAETTGDIPSRIALLAQAARVATAGSEAQRTARRKGANLRVALLGEPPLGPLARHEAREAALELEAIGEGVEAARAFALAGDKEGQARALTLAGDIDALEGLLGAEEQSRKAVDEKKRFLEEIQELASAGLRRDALQLTANAPVEGGPAETFARTLRGRRALGPRLRLALLGRPFRVLFGDEVIVGRTEGALLVPSQALSRRHLSLAAKRGKLVVRDLGSRNGTRYRGLPLGAPLELEAAGEVELRLGGEVPLTLAPSRLFEGAWELAVGGETWIVPLGPLRLGVGDWALVPGPDDWIELHGAAPSIAAAGLAMHPKTTLLLGDQFTAGRDGELALQILEAGP